MSASSDSRAIRKPLRRCVAAARPFAACLLAIACSSGGGSGGHGGGGAGGQGQGGASGGSSGGSSSAGAAGTQGAGGSAVGTGGSGVAGSASGGSGGSAGSGGSGGSGGSAGGSGGTGAAGQTGSGGAAGGAGGRGGSAGRGGASGSAGTAGSGAGGSAGAGGGAANPVTPTMSGSLYRFTWGDVVMEIDASVGARVATLSLSGSNIIVPQSMAAHLDGGAATDPTTWGSVFWTSPRSAWTPVTWPPPPNIDNAAYQTSIAGTHVMAAGMTDTSIGVSMAKDYSVDATSGWITIAYTIKATKAQKAAPWEVSRVPRGGLTFFPVPGASSVVNQVPLTITQTGSSPTIVWFDDGPKTATSPNGDKLYADGSGGWTAYVINGNLFLKKFTDIPASSQPTGEGEVDVYPGNGFLEFEVEGPYTMIATSGTLQWSIQWKVVKIPNTVTIAAGSTSLANFVMQQLAN